MRTITTRPGYLILATLLAAPSTGSALAQPLDESNPNIIVTGELQPDTSAMTEGPELKGVITARKGDKIKVTSAEGLSTVVYVDNTTKVRSGGLFGGRSKLGADSLLNGMPVSVKTMQAGPVLLARQVTFRNGDFKTANMIRHGTAQGFAEQTAATEALRGRMADIDQYNIKDTTNVYFATGKSALTPQAKADLCNAASQAEAIDNALMLVVGYTDSVGSQDYNQELSERRASSVINHLQQACRWKPYRMLTPTGMAEADPVADNYTAEGKAQNRRVAVNILVSKGLDGL